MGQFGFIGFLSEFGLLALPIFRTASAIKFAETKKEQLFLAALALILAINIVDLLPNAGADAVYMAAGGNAARTH